MTKTLEATFDGSVFRPEEPVELQPNTRVQNDRHGQAHI